MKLHTSLTRMLPDYPRELFVLGLGSFINIAGLSLLWPVNAIYIHSDLGQSMMVAGLVLMVYSGAGFLGSVISGWLYDRVGLVPVLVLGLGLSAVLICFPVFFHYFWVYILVMLSFGLTCAMPFPALTTMAGQIWPEGGRRPFNFIYVTNNLGVAVGTALGGFLAQVSFTSVFVGIAAAYIILLVLVVTLFRRRFGEGGRLTPKSLTNQQDPVMSMPAHVFPRVPWLAVVVLLGGFIACWVAYVQWQSTVSVYMQSLGYPLSLYSILWTLNGILIFVGQPLVRIGTKWVRELPQQMLLGVLFYIIAFAILLFSHRYYGFVLAMVITTLGEMFAWPAVPAAVAQLAPQHRAGFLQGLAGSSATLGRMLGPVMGGFLFDAVGEHVALEFFAAWLALPFVLFLIYGRLDKTADRPVGLT